MRRNNLLFVPLLAGALVWLATAVVSADGPPDVGWSAVRDIHASNGSQLHMEHIEWYGKHYCFAVNQAVSGGGGSGVSMLAVECPAKVWGN